MAGIELECSYNDYLQWLPSIRPYKSPEELPWKEFVDQCYLVYFEYIKISGIYITIASSESINHT